VYELSDSSGLVITVGKYLTPRGVDIDRYGIAPDFRSRPGRAEAEAALQACRLQAATDGAAEDRGAQVGKKAAAADAAAVAAMVQG
jgi:C-terminal processing protease CtpA/Prc